MRSLLLGSCLLLVMTPPLTAKDRPWVDKPYSEWTLEETTHVLFRSPWVKQERASYYGAEIPYFVRLLTAKPMKQALARWSQYRPEPHVVHMGRFDPEKAQAVLGAFDFPGRIVVAVLAAFPAFQMPLNRATLDGLRAETYLQVGGKKERLFLISYVPPYRAPAGHALFIFDRPANWEGIKKVRFVTRFGRRFRVKLKPRFKIKELYFEGRPEL